MTAARHDAAESRTWYSYADPSGIAAALSRLVPCGDPVSPEEMDRRCATLPAELHQVIVRDAHLAAAFRTMFTSAIEWDLAKVLTALVLAGYSKQLDIMAAFSDHVARCGLRA